MKKILYSLLLISLASCSLGKQNEEGKISFFKIIEQKPSGDVDYKGENKDPDQGKDYKIISESEGIPPESP